MPSCKLKLTQPIDIVILACQSAPEIDKNTQSINANALCCTSGKAGVPSVRHGNYKKWLRYYLDFWGMYRLAVGYSKSPLDL